ncbi:hypothetical protein Ato02nite_008050 [Paractinoplanes toevensis]|uniref:NADP-dependent oxidoreductase domain-containing protein n=2 Tax=Paractinoplanes toevensis TaxID=571911 RepID=A0A919VYH1_9ACTN|nr:hypothetical protein Ato02nite_008050 [Actinoplanes toevensis]
MRLTVDPDPGTAVRVLRRAVDLGVQHIDTATFYFSPGGILDAGDGPARYATELIRRALSPYAESLLIGTKVGPGILPDGSWGAARTAGQLRFRSRRICDGSAWTGSAWSIYGERGIAFVPFFAIAGPGKENGASAEQDAVVEAVAARHGVTAHQVRLAWTLHQGGARARHSGHRQRTASGGECRGGRDSAHR